VGAEFLMWAAVMSPPLELPLTTRPNGFEFIFYSEQSLKLIDVFHQSISHVHLIGVDKMQRL